MKVILRTTVPKVGKTGQVVKVKPGYARNFLFPRGMAVIADKGQMRALETQNARLAAKQADTKAEAEGVAEKLNHKTLRVEVKVGEQGKLFGAVTSSDIAELLNNEFGTSVDKKDVVLLQPIKRTGKYPISVDIHREVDIQMSVLVLDPALEEETKKVEEEAPVAEVPAEEAAAETEATEEAPAEA